MVDFTERDIERAGSIVEQLFGRPIPFSGAADAAWGRHEFHTDEFESGLSIADVDLHSTLFRIELELLNRAKLGVPVVSIRERPPIPVSLEVLGLPPATRWFGLVREPIPEREDDIVRSYRRRVSRWLDRESLPTLRRYMVTPDVALQSFALRARHFLATRLAGLRFRDDDGAGPRLNVARFFGGPSADVAGCKFSVTADTLGLTAYWSGAYYISPNYLGHPTNRASGVLQSGTYVFGLSGGPYGRAIIWDPNAVCSLPGASSVHLNF
jgi:hypothetical protein